MIQTAEISIVVNDTIDSVNIITNLANEANGFVVSSEISNYQNVSGKKYQSASIVIRIPSEKLEDSLSRIKKLAVEVNSERIRGQDVTSDYVDLKSRLGNLETAEKQLQEILKNANKADEVLNTFKELVKVREEIEVIKGRMKYYEESAALSSISISITPSITSTPIQVGWKPEGTVKRAAELFIEALQGIADFLIVFTIARLPFLVVFGVPTFFIGRWGWRKYQARKKPTPSVKR
ncbi:MAG: DUF4349 domain-containing protein [Chloroflexi bacterium]|nr:DUF4349 domain-containing protein [Chloroflexota bacterium]